MIPYTIHKCLFCLCLTTYNIILLIERNSWLLSICSKTIDFWKKSKENEIPLVLNPNFFLLSGGPRSTIHPDPRHSGQHSLLHHHRGVVARVPSRLVPGVERAHLASADPAPARHDTARLQGPGCGSGQAEARETGTCEQDFINLRQLYSICLST